jgi:hypothetical protein
MSCGRMGFVPCRPSLLSPHRRVCTVVLRHVSFTGCAFHRRPRRRPFLKGSLGLTAAGISGSDRETRTQGRGATPLPDGDADTPLFAQWVVGVRQTPRLFFLPEHGFLETAGSPLFRTGRTSCEQGVAGSWICWATPDRPHPRVFYEPLGERVLVVQLAALVVREAGRRAER